MVSATVKVQPFIASKIRKKCVPEPSICFPVRAEPSQTIVFGSGLESSTNAVNPHVFSVELRDREGFELKSSDSMVRVSILGPQTVKITQAKAHRHSSKFRYKYSAFFPGTYEVHISVDDVEIPKSPFVLEIYAVSLSIDRNDLQDSLDQQLVDFSVWSGLNRGGHLNFVSVSIKNSIGKDVQSFITDQFDGSYSVSFTPRMEGSYTISASIWNSKVSDCVSVTFSGSTLLKWLKEQLYPYPDVKVQNFTDSWSDGRALIALMDSLTPGSFIYDSMTFNATKNVTIALNLAKTYLEEKKLLEVADFSENPKHRIVMDFIQKLKAKDYERARILVRIEDNLRSWTPSPKNSSAFGRGVSNCVNSESPHKFVVSLRNADNRAICSARLDQNHIYVTISGPQLVTPILYGQDGNSMTYMYEAVHPGKYVVNIRMNGRHINGSPFDVEIYSEKCVVTKESNHLTRIGEETYLLIGTGIARGGFSSEVSVAIRDPNNHSVPISIEDRHNGNYVAKFVPLREGKYLAKVNVWGNPISFPDKTMFFSDDPRKINRFHQNCRPSFWPRRIVIFLSLFLIFEGLFVGILYLFDINPFRSNIAYITAVLCVGFLGVISAHFDHQSLSILFPFTIAILLFRKVFWFCDLFVLPQTKSVIFCEVFVMIAFVINLLCIPFAFAFYVQRKQLRLSGTDFDEIGLISVNTAGVPLLQPGASLMSSRREVPSVVIG